jgi:hypothetical protein
MFRVDAPEILAAELDALDLQALPYGSAVSEKQRLGISARQIGRRSQENKEVGGAHLWTHPAALMVEAPRAGEDRSFGCDFGCDFAGVQRD